METIYRYSDYFAGVYRKCRCRLIDQRAKTALIQLIEFGPKNKPPGTIMRVHVKSLDWNKVIDHTQLGWHEYTDI